MSPTGATPCCTLLAQEQTTQQCIQSPVHHNPGKPYSLKNSQAKCIFVPLWNSWRRIFVIPKISMFHYSLKLFDDHKLWKWYRHKISLMSQYMTWKKERLHVKTLPKSLFYWPYHTVLGSHLTLFFASVWAPLDSNACTTSKCPLCAAEISGVDPDWIMQIVYTHTHTHTCQMSIGYVLGNTKNSVANCCSFTLHSFHSRADNSPMHSVFCSQQYQETILTEEFPCKMHLRSNMKFMT